MTNEFLLGNTGLGLPDNVSDLHHRFSSGSGETHESVEFVLGGEETDRRAHAAAVAKALAQELIGTSPREGANLWLHDVGSYTKWRPEVFEERDRYVFSWHYDRSNVRATLSLDMKTGAASFYRQTW